MSTNDKIFAELVIKMIQHSQSVVRHKADHAVVDDAIRTVATFFREWNTVGSGWDGVDDEQLVESYVYGYFRLPVPA